MHPYECNGAGKCVHHDRRKTETHNPATCALCDPDYDFQPNEFRFVPTRLIRVGEHECFTCTKCSTTFGIIHSVCPVCALEWRVKNEIT